MKTETVKKANRGHLKRAALKGNLWVKCKYHYTDDYAYDYANEYGKQDDFSRVVIIPEFDDTEFKAAKAAALESGDVSQICEARDNEQRAYQNHRMSVRDANPGCCFFDLRDFTTASGSVWGDTESGTWSIHSNLTYAYEIRK